MNRKHNRLRKPANEEMIGLAVGEEAMKFGREILQEVIRVAAKGQKPLFLNDTVKEESNGNVTIIPKQITLTWEDGETVEFVIYRYAEKARIQTLSEFNAFMNACESGVHIDHQ